MAKVGIVMGSDSDLPVMGRTSFLTTQRRRQTED